MAENVTYKHHRAAEHHAFRAPTGMVGMWTKQQAEKVAAHSRLVTAPRPGVGKGYATGETVANIRVRGPVIGRSGPEAEVAAVTDHGIHLHEGTPPHEIKARVANKMVFFWHKAGRVVSASKVFHPGTKANPFLVKALRHVFGGPGR